MADASLPKSRYRGKKHYIQTPADFWSRVAITDDPKTCWEWKGKTANGYGLANFAGESYAHRVAFAITHGHRATKWVLHKCDNPPCVNPNHLYDGTPKDNAQDRELRGRSPRKRLVGRTHCKHGHEITPENTFTNSRGCSGCRACRTASAKKYEQTRPIKDRREEKRISDKRRYHERKAERLAEVSGSILPDEIKDKANLRRVG